MIIWRGFGVVIVAIVFGCSLVAQLLCNAATGSSRYWEAHAWPFGTAVMAAGGVTWCVARLLSRRPRRVLVDEASGRRVEINKPHDLFFIPVRYWALILLAAGAAVILTNAAPGPARATASVDAVRQGK